MSKENPNKPESTSPSNPKSPSGFGVMIGFVLFSLNALKLVIPFSFSLNHFLSETILGMTALIQESQSLFFLAPFPHAVNSF